MLIWESLWSNVVVQIYDKCILLLIVNFITNVVVSLDA